MRWHQPSQALARVWLVQFNEALARATATGFRDAEAVSHALRALRSLYEREPDCADLVTGLIVAFLANARDRLPAVRVLDAVDVGLTAERIRSDDDGERPLQRAALRLAAGRAGLDDYDPFSALDAAGEARRELSDASGPIADLLTARADLLTGDAWDTLLEPTRAAEAYRSAREFTVPLLAEKTAIVPTLVHLVLFLDGDARQAPDELRDARLRLLWRELSVLHAMSSVGVARCSAALSAATRNADALDAAGALEKVGLGPVQPLDLAPVLHGCDPVTAMAMVERVVHVAAAVGLDPTPFRAVLGSAAAVAAAAHGVPVDVFLRTSRPDIADLEDPLLAAAALGDVLVALAGAEPPAADAAASDFERALARLVDRRNDRLRNLRIRALFDRPLAALIDRTSARFARDATRHDRIRLARLLDTLAEDSHAFPALLASVSADAIPGAQDASDRLGRLEAALRTWPDAAALVIRTLGSETVFVCVTGAAPVAVIRVDERYGTAARALTNAVAEATAALELVPPPPSEEFEALGRAAFDALPDEVRQLVREHPVLLVQPDHRAGGDRVPIELFRDGSDWLGATRVISRHPTLRALVRAVEGTTRRDPHRRALTFAVAEADEMPSLRMADDEADWVREHLAANGWDAPVIGAERATARFLIDWLPYVTHLHVAAHGETTGYDEALLLTGGALRSDDLVSRFFPRLPTVYLNTCWLGSSRYVGAGVSRGVAHALSVAGAPAVVANLLPVEDTASAEFAKVFYTAGPDVGTAVRTARRAAAEAGVSPVLWGATILIGDPRITLEPGRPPGTMAERLLDAHFASPGDVDSATIGEAERALRLGGADPRLTAAVALLQFMSMWDGEAFRTDRSEIAAALALALDLDHLPAAAIVAVHFLDAIDDQAEPDLAVAALEECLELVEPLEHQADIWRRILDGVLSRWMQSRSGDRRVEVRVTGPGGEADDESLSVGRAIMEIQLAQQARSIRRGDAVVPRPEHNAEDVCWNAVIASRELALDDMPEVVAYCRQVVNRLAAFGAIGAVRPATAATAMAGLLPWLWDSQHATDLPREFALGQTGTLLSMLASLSEHWPPASAPWFAAVEDFPDHTRAALAALDSIPYSGALDDAITDVMQRIEEHTRQRLDRVEREYPDRRPDAAAWLLGTVAEVNTYSWADGSVPEELSNRLRRVGTSLAADAEGWFWPWLIAGFREDAGDELDRWKHGYPTADRTPE